MSSLESKGTQAFGSFSKRKKKKEKKTSESSFAFFNVLEALIEEAGGW